MYSVRMTVNNRISITCIFWYVIFFDDVTTWNETMSKTMFVSKKRYQFLKSATI